MDKRKLTAALGASASLIALSSLVGSGSAYAGACVAASAATYEAAGFSCSVGPLTFSNFNLFTQTTGIAVLTVTGFNPVTLVVGGHTEYGFALSYTADAFGIGSPVPLSTTDLALNYNVTSKPGNMVDSYMAFTGATGVIPGVAPGAGAFASAVLSETLSNGVTMSLDAPGVASDNFLPGQITNNINAIKDQDNAAYNGDFADTSVLVDAFSVSGAVPEPGTMALFGAGLLGSALWLHRRRRIKLA